MLCSRLHERSWQTKIIKVIEAALLKKPSIIALNNSYNNDTAKKNNCLILNLKPKFLLENKILYLIKNKSIIKKMGISAFKNAKKILILIKIVSYSKLICD